MRGANIKIAQIYDSGFLDGDVKVQKINLICNNKGRTSANDAVYFHGWLMSRISEDFAARMHQTGVNPVTIAVHASKEQVVFSIAMLTDEAAAEIAKVLLDPDFASFTLKSTRQEEFKIVKKEQEILSSQDLAQAFYQPEKTKRLLQVLVKTPLAFKTNGEYYNLPDTRLFFQSLMKKYNAIFEKTEQIDLDLLDELCDKVKLVNFSIHSRRFYIHKAYINGFCGKLAFYCNGAETLANYAAMLLRFAEYAGVGVKTSLGMGSVELTEGEHNG